MVNGGIIYIPWLATSSPFTFDTNFTSNSINFCFCTLPSFLLASSLFDYPCYMHLSLGDKKTTHLHTLLSVCELNNRCVVPKTLEKENCGSLTMMPSDIYIMICGLDG